MTSKVIEVDFLNQKSDQKREPVQKKPAGIEDFEAPESRAQKLKRLAESIEKGTYAPNIDDVAEAVLADILLDEGAKTDK